MVRQGKYKNYGEFGSRRDLLTSITLGYISKEKGKQLLRQGDTRKNGYYHKKSDSIQRQ